MKPLKDRIGWTKKDAATLVVSPPGTKAPPTPKA